MLVIFLVGKRDFLRLWLHTHGSRTHARTYRSWHKRVGQPFWEACPGGLELSMRRQVEDKMCASDASSAFGARRQREPKAFTPENGAEPNCTAGSLFHFSLRYFWKRIYFITCTSFSHSQISVRVGGGRGVKERAAFQFIKGKLFLKSTFNHNTLFLMQYP